MNNFHLEIINQPLLEILDAINLALDATESHTGKYSQTMQEARRYMHAAATEVKLLRKTVNH